MKGILIFVALVGSGVQTTRSDAVTRWIPASEGDMSCHFSCGRAGLEAVMTHAKDRQSVPVGISRGKKILGKPNKQMGLSPNTFCLCAQDGSDKGSDFAWASNSAKERCDQTCGKMAPHYGYAVYIDRDKKNSWRQVCANKNGQIGYSRKRLADCYINRKPQKNFGCLCTRSFVPDLDPNVDP